MKADKRTTQFARQLYKLSLGADGRLSSERVAAVLACIEKTKPARALALLQTYHRHLAAEVGRSQALIEHAGPVSDALVAQIAAAMTKKYNRPITPAPKPAPALLAGLRIRVGDDLYDASAHGALEQLATATTA
ncbi:MAG: F0F1 ATP synthase subunit delta [Opitutaceae bacterium]|jgi:F-type H+-transporting ATPase subunit delta|nr:F0F1 ATP synthase subunit delta [Opitutaceae bacterium]